MAFLEVKGSLAKLLATENLHVQHDGAANTASFNTATRVLTLPILETESSHVYDMFVGHEVGHALYTPADWRDHVAEEVPFDYVNVIEDCRIEKMIQAKFPGLRKDFAHGYTELNDKDFFDIADKDLSKLSFIDRINLHFKLGARAIINFTTEEMVYVNLVDDAKTFDDVCFAAKMLSQYTKAKRKEEQDKQAIAVESEGADEGETDQPTPDEVEGDNEPSNEQQTEPGDTATKQSQPDEDVAETQRAMDEAMKDMAGNSNSVTYINVGESELSPYPLEFLREDFETMAASRIGRTDYAIEMKFKKFMASIKRDVNYMVQQFEMKKSADAYARQQIHKTGVLNTNVLHNYRLTDDLFLRQTITPDGKNHGLFMLIDWSGSMSDNIVATVKQLLMLVQFCRKVNIPYEVYTFTCTGYGLPDELPDEHIQKNHVALHGINVTHVLSSSSKRRDTDKDMWHLFSQAWKLMFQYSGAIYSNQLSMGGTPLNNTLIGMPKLIEKFKTQNNIQKVSFVCLTDGESSPLHYYGHGTYGSRVCMTNPWHTNLLRDGHKVYQLEAAPTETESLVQYLCKKVPGITVTNIFLAGPKGAQRYMNHHTRQLDNDMTEYKKTGSQSFTTTTGWPLIAIVNPRNFLDPAEELDVEAGAGKAKVRTALKKFLKNKSSSKLLLSTLVSQFS